MTTIATTVQIATRGQDQRTSSKYSAKEIIEYKTNKLYEHAQTTPNLLQFVDCLERNKMLRPNRVPSVVFKGITDSATSGIQYFEMEEDVLPKTVDIQSIDDSIYIKEFHDKGITFVRFIPEHPQDGMDLTKTIFGWDSKSECINVVRPVALYHTSKHNAFTPKVLDSINSYLGGKIEVITEGKFNYLQALDNSQSGDDNVCIDVFSDQVFIKISQYDWKIVRWSQLTMNTQSFALFDKQNNELLLFTNTKNINDTIVDMGLYSDGIKPPSTTVQTDRKFSNRTVFAVGKIHSKNGVLDIKQKINHNIEREQKLHKLALTTEFRVK